MLTVGAGRNDEVRTTDRSIGGYSPRCGPKPDKELLSPRDMKMVRADKKKLEVEVASRRDSINIPQTTRLTKRINTPQSAAMLCGISGEAPLEPVVSLKSGTIYEKRLLEQYISEHGTEPSTGEPLLPTDFLPIQSSRIVRPRPPTLTSIPALLAAFQNEWDALALETYNLKEQLARTREELATALYQHDAAVRVVARLSRERDEAREALGKVSVAEAGDEMAVDSVEALGEDLAAEVDETHSRFVLNFTLLSLLLLITTDYPKDVSDGHCQKAMSPQTKSQPSNQHPPHSQSPKQHPSQCKASTQQYLA